MINRIILEGRLGADPERRETPTGKVVARLALPLFNPFQKENDSSEWIQCEVWNKPAEFICQYGKKGNLVSLEGRLRSQKFVGNDGVTKYRNFVSVDRLTLLESRNKNTNENTNSQPINSTPISSNQPLNDPMIQENNGSVNIELEIPSSSNDFNDMFKEFDKIMGN